MLQRLIIGFNVRPDPTARKLAESLGIEILLYRVIYEAIDDIKAAMEGMLEPEYQEVVLGQAEVRALFKVPNVGVVAGCYVTEGKILRSAQIRVIRDNVVIYEGNISSLKRFKDDVREVASGYECGIGVEKFQDLKEGDILRPSVLKSQANCGNKVMSMVIGVSHRSLADGKQFPQVQASDGQKHYRSG